MTAAACPALTSARAALRRCDHLAARSVEHLRHLLLRHSRDRHHALFSLCVSGTAAAGVCHHSGLWRRTAAQKAINKSKDIRAGKTSAAVRMSFMTDIGGIRRMCLDCGSLRKGQTIVPAGRRTCGGAEGAAYFYRKTFSTGIVISVTNFSLSRVKPWSIIVISRENPLALRLCSCMNRVSRRYCSGDWR